MKKILIVDDDPGILKVVEFRLKKMGYEVIVAVDGKEGLIRAKEMKPDLVVLDFRMPFLNGDEVCQQIREDETIKNIPIILMTASTQSTALENLQAMGVTDCVLKPFDPDDLLGKIKKCLNES